MAFRTYINVGEVVKAYGLRLETTSADFPTTAITAPTFLKQEIQLTLDRLPFDVSEAAICDNLIYPILREVWKQYADTFTVWSHQPIALNEELNGVPDYMFTRQSPAGRTVLDAPYVAVVEAKRDDFTQGWAQCGLEMYTMQQLNNDTRPVYGIVSNGRLWELGVLSNTVLTRYTEGFSIRDMDVLFSALTYVLEECKRIYNL